MARELKHRRSSCRRRATATTLNTPRGNGYHPSLLSWDNYPKDERNYLGRWRNKDKRGSGSDDYVSTARTVVLKMQDAVAEAMATNHHLEQDDAELVNGYRQFLIEAGVSEADAEKNAGHLTLPHRSQLHLHVATDDEPENESGDHEVMEDAHDYGGVDLLTLLMTLLMTLLDSSAADSTEDSAGWLC